MGYSSSPTTPADNLHLDNNLRHNELRSVPEPQGFSDIDGDASKISAYARLDFDNYTFFVQTLQVVLGRKSNDEIAHHLVDVHLSSKKAISRRHAKIFYNFGTQRFEISIMGRNGAFVDDLFVEKGMTVPLVDGTKIQIGDIPFSFVLPSIELHDLDAKKPATKPFNPSDALNLRTNLYLVLPPREKKKSVSDRRNSKADIVRRLSTAYKSHTSTNDEINALLKELESLEGGEYDPDLLDDEIQHLLGKDMTQAQIKKEEDEIDKLVNQHNLSQGVDTRRDLDMTMLDREIASLAPLISDGLKETKGDSIRPRMGKPASIQPPPNRVYRNVPSFPYLGYTERPKLEVVVETIPATPKIERCHNAITTSYQQPSVCVFRTVNIPGARAKERKVSKVHALKDIPEQFRAKPNVSVLAMVLAVMRTEPRRNLTLSDIHDAIREMFPYYRYCPDGWQATVTHHIRFSRMLVATKNGHESDWLWTYNDAYVTEKDRTRRKQQEIAMAKAKESALKALELRHKLGMYRYDTRGERPKSIAELASEIRREPSKEPVSIKEQLAANRARSMGVPGALSPGASLTGAVPGAVPGTMPGSIPGTPLGMPAGAQVGTSSVGNPSAGTAEGISPSPVSRARPPIHAPGPTRPSPGLPARSTGSSASPAPSVPVNTDSKKALGYLQKELFTLYKARKLSYNTTVTTEIITKALTTTIAQVNTIGARAGCGDNALNFLVEKAPDQVSKILDIALTKSIREKEGMISKESTPVPESRAASPLRPSGLTKPTFGGPGRPAFSGPKPTFAKGLTKPPQFLSNKRVEKRPGDDKDDPNKMVKLE